MPPTGRRTAMHGEPRKLYSSYMTICKSCNRATGNHGQQQQPEPLNMSRIFEALQRSESERSGVASAPPVLATELLQAVERDTVGLAPTNTDVKELVEKDFASGDFDQNEFTGGDGDL